jgi:hypothetical protein
MAGGQHCAGGSGNANFDDRARPAAAGGVDQRSWYSCDLAQRRQRRQPQPPAMRARLGTKDNAR